MGFLYLTWVTLPQKESPDKVLPRLCLVLIMCTVKSAPLSTVRLLMNMMLSGNSCTELSSLGWLETPTFAQDNVNDPVDFATKKPGDTCT